MKLEGKEGINCEVWMDILIIAVIALHVIVALLARQVWPKARCLQSLLLV